MDGIDTGTASGLNNATLSLSTRIEIKLASILLLLLLIREAEDDEEEEEDFNTCT